MREDGLGALASEVADRIPDKRARVIELEVERGNLLVDLHGEGYSRLYGTSSRRSVYDLPHYTSIRYLYSRSTQTHLPQSFADCCVLLRPPSLVEVGRVAELLKGDGFAFFPAPGGVPADQVARLGLRKAGEVGAGVVCWEKSESATGQTQDAVSILTYSTASGGMGEYARLLVARFSSARVKAEMVDSARDASASSVVVEYANGLSRGGELVRDVELLAAQGKRVVVKVHDTLERFKPEERLWLQRQATLTYRANEAAERDGVRRYVIVPHASYTNMPALPSKEAGGLVIGSFGFAAKYKRYPLIIRLARRLQVPLRLMVSLNAEVGVERSMTALKQIEQEFGSAIPGPGSYSSGEVELKVGFFEPVQIAKAMEECSHIVFAHTTSNLQNSGVMTMAKRFSRPIVALDSFQARQAQAVRVMSFFKAHAVGRAVKSFGASLLHKRLEVGALIRNLEGILAEESLSKEFLESHLTELSRDEDGFEYLSAVLEHPQ
ncbi:MAG: hypothetical protein LYZ69_08245 [Nitrososphaerales archaeon]|nr:hypothetical protein [Nitrososphaerales archaeon]